MGDISPLRERGSLATGNAKPPEAANDISFAPLKSSKAALRVRLYAGLVLTDVVALVLSFILADAVRLGTPFGQPGFEVLVRLLPLYLIISLHSGAYSLEVLQRPKTGMRLAAGNLAVAVGLVLILFFFLKAGAEFSRLLVGTGSVIAFVAVLGARWSFGQLTGRRHNWNFLNEVMLVDDVPVLPVRGEIVVLADKAQLYPSSRDPKLLDRLGTLLRNSDRVVLACPPERRAAWVAMLKGLGVDVEVVAPELEELGALGMRRMGDRSTVLVNKASLPLRDRMLKRCFDLALTLPALVGLAPVFAVVALAIKLDSKGPIFFDQERMGYGNRMFRVLKFRTMRAELTDHHGGRSATRADERVTRVGRFLRRTSLDELPQLLNVVKGEMSIVGPRPHALGSTAENLLFWDIDARYWERHMVKPGITGLAQVRGFRGATHAQSDLFERLQADLEYVTDWSIWRDLGILLATTKVVLHKNAY